MNKLFSALIFSAVATLSMNTYAAAPDTTKPATAKPAEAAKPATAAKPAEAAKPAVAATPAKPAEAAKPGATEKLDINTATEKQLREFPGIGAARASAIIKGRPYKTKDELANKKIIPQAVYEKIKDNIIAKQAK